MRGRWWVLAALALIAGCGRGGATEVKVAVTDNGFEPDSVAVEHGRPATLVITRQSDGTCATEAVFRETGKRYDLPLGQPVRIPIVTTSPTTWHYACGMDMYEGKVVVK